MTTVTVFRCRPPPVIGVCGVVFDRAVEAFEQNLVPGLVTCRRCADALSRASTVRTLARSTTRSQDPPPSLHWHRLGCVAADSHQCYCLGW